jgi:SAM-dependent methyltransferase
MNSHQGLTPTEARAFYDAFGSKQDSQGFYEDPPLAELIAHAGFEDARSVFEFGCGTGKLAARLLADHLPENATYAGTDVSPVMIGLATERLAPYAARVTLLPSSGEVRFPVPDESVDRVVSSYVVDLLPEEGIGRFFDEASRVLVPGGRLCLAGLTEGNTLLSRIVSTLWMGAFTLRPSLVGGCRPVRLERWIDDRRWRMVHRAVRTPFAVPSEVLVLEAKEPGTASSR